MTTLSKLNWETLSAPWQSSIEDAWAAYREGSVPVGAVIVDADGCIVATGRNRRSERVESARGGHSLAHAELNALFRAAPGVELRSCSLYTTLEPCPLCTGALAMAHVNRVEYAARDLWAGSTGLLDASAFLRSRQITVAGPFYPRLEELMLALNVDYWLGQPSPSARKLVELWRVAFPAAVELGEHCFGDGALQSAAREGLSARDALSCLDAAGVARRSIA